MTIRQHEGDPSTDPNSGDYRFWHILVRDAFTCQLCGTRRNLQVHHMHYRSKGGADEAENLLTLCQACHAAVHARSVVLGS